MGNECETAVSQAVTQLLSPVLGFLEDRVTLKWVVASAKNGTVLSISPTVIFIRLTFNIRLATPVVSSCGTGGTSTNVLRTTRETI